MLGQKQLLKGSSMWNFHLHLVPAISIPPSTSMPTAADLKKIKAQAGEITAGALSEIPRCHQHRSQLLIF